MCEDKHADIELLFGTVHRITVTVMDHLLTKWKSPKRWYDTVRFESELLRTYAQNIEGQIKESIDKYHKEKEVVIDEIDGEFANITEFHQGLDGSTYDLGSVFEEYFPNLQRRSALITLFSFLEFQLDELCKLFQGDQKFSISLSDLKDKGIDRSYSYLTKVVGLNIDKSSAIWNELKRIQGLRNVIVHNDGRMKNNDEIRKSDLLDEKPSSLFSEEKEVILLEGYLKHVLDSFDTYFKELNTKIQQK